MQLYSGPKQILEPITFDEPNKTRESVKDATSILIIAAIVSAVAVQVVKTFGLANGMDEHNRLILSYVGLALCFVSAPTFLIFGKHLSMKAGFALGATVIFVVAFLASLVA